jgi:hypothetical protein
MRGMRGSLYAIALALIACRSSSSATVDAGDGGTAYVVACGTAQQPMTCSLPGSACCDFAPGAGSDYCFAVAGGTCEGGVPIACDGPEDCSGGNVCCYDSSTGSSCAPPVECASGSSAIMCHLGDDSPCGAGSHCCGLHAAGPSSGGPFGICMLSCPL